MNDLIAFLADVALNPRIQLAFEHNPDPVLAAAALSPEDAALIKSGSQPRIMASVAPVGFQAASFFGDPAPDPLPDPDPTPPPPHYSPARG